MFEEIQDSPQDEQTGQQCAVSVWSRAFDRFAAEFHERPLKLRRFRDLLPALATAYLHVDRTTLPTHFFGGVMLDFKLLTSKTKSSPDKISPGKLPPDMHATA
jgi:hypothetical protein